MSLVESSPRYEPSHPATASMSTEMQQRASGDSEHASKPLGTATHVFEA